MGGLESTADHDVILLFFARCFRSEV
jgi:hypothetical protein